MLFTCQTQLCNPKHSDKAESSPWLPTVMTGKQWTSYPGKKINLLETLKGSADREF